MRFFGSWVGVGRLFGFELYPDLPREDVPEHSLENLILPRTYFGRSEIRSISFQNTDLIESTLCWNDFIKVNFTNTDLSGADLRASIFKRVAFVQANLRKATFAAPPSRAAILRLRTWPGRSGPGSRASKSPSPMSSER